MTRIAVCAYSHIKTSINRWWSAVLCTRQFCSNVPCSGSRVSELADRQSQNCSVRSACKIIFKVVCDWWSANSLTRDPLYGTLEQNWCVRKTAEHQRLVETSIREYVRIAIRVMGRHPYYVELIYDRKLRAITVRYCIAVNTTAADVFNSGPCSLSLINHVEWTKTYALCKGEFPLRASCVTSFITSRN